MKLLVVPVEALEREKHPESAGMHVLAEQSGLSSTEGCLVGSTQLRQKPKMGIYVGII